MLAQHADSPILNIDKYEGDQRVITPCLDMYTCQVRMQLDSSSCVPQKAVSARSKA